MPRILCAAVVGALTACSPYARLEGGADFRNRVQASLPCKPDQVQRSVELAGAPVDLQMSGCEAGGATFAVACAAVQDPRRRALR